jgi:hypothetical protein
MSKSYKRKFIEQLFDPKFHWLFFKARLKVNFVDAPLYRRVMSVLFALITICVVSITNAWLTYLIVWVFPLTILYHMSALAQFTSEHIWLSDSDDNTTKSHARFCGEAPPTNDHFQDWTWWWLKIALYYLPIRIAVLCAELIAHDIHHTHPKQDKEGWRDIIYERQRLVDAGLVKSAEYWGLHNAMNAVFENLAEQEPLSLAEIDQLLND